MLEQGCLFAFLGLGVLITFRFFRFPDLTAEGSYPLGGAVVAALLVGRVNPFVATGVAALAGAAAGVVTGHRPHEAPDQQHHRRHHRDDRHLLGEHPGHGPLEHAAARDGSVFDDAVAGLAVLGLPVRGGPLANILVLVVALTVVALALGAFFRTDLGLAVRATGENETMIRGLGVNTNRTKILGLAISNAVIALSGALVAQNHGFADIGMGIGVLVTGAAAVLIGEAIFGDRTVGWWIVAAIVGVVIYRFLVALALRVGFQPTDLRLVTALLLLAALMLPRLRFTVASG